MSDFKKGFDEVNIVKQGENEITYGIIHGNNTIVFIKAGMNGTFYGYKNKYQKIAKQLNKKHGCTVISASNPGFQTDFDSEMKSLQAYAYYHNWEDYQVYYMGHSNGAVLGIMNAHKYSEIKKVIAINATLSINPQILIPAIQMFNGEKMNIICGSKDPSYNLLDPFSALESDKIEFVRIYGADHYFTNCLELFMALPGFFFFDDEFEYKKVIIKK